jgi:energy-coupling factor transporter ATP-binding protein EcfA2
MSAVANVAYPLERRGVSRRQALERAQETLSDFQLKAFAERMPNTLSGGQQQRVALARAAICEPRLLLLDEPFKGLEQDLRDELIALVRGMCRAGTSVILVTHEIRELQLAADSVLLLRQGRVVGNAARDVVGTGPFDLPLRRMTIPCASSPSGAVEATGARLLLNGSGINGEQLTTITLQEIRSLGFGHLAVLAEFDVGGTRWIDVEHRHLSLLVPGQRYQLAYQPISEEAL